MAQLTVQNVVQTGLTETLASAAGGGDSFLNPSDGRTYFKATNGSGASITVTFTRQRTSQLVPGEGNVTLANLAVAVPAGASRLIGPFGDSFNDASGLVQVTYSAVTSLTVGAIRVPAVS